MKSAMFYLAHSTAIAGLMIVSYVCGFKKAANITKEKIFNFSKK
jgi:hypothetical protein